MLLEPEQEQLLGTLVEASRRVADRSDRVFTIFLPDGPAFIGGGGLPPGQPLTEDDDVPVLEHAGR